MVIRIGIIGTGNVFPAYLRTLRKQRKIRIVGVADLQPAIAQARAAEFALTAMSVEELLASPAQIVLNITPPLAHHAVGMAVLNAGKHLFNEKPLAATFAQGQELVALAAAKNLCLGCAPDTVLGAGCQTVRALVDAGAVGRIAGGSAHFMNHGPDHWHPNPDFFYGPGGGPMHDMGPYYISHLVHHLGPVAELNATARRTWSERTIPRGANAGRGIKVEVPTTVVAQLRFISGAAVSLTVSFDVWKHAHTPIELYGEQGTIRGHDPNQFGGKVHWSRQDGDWQIARERRPYTTNSRGIGLLDMALAIEHRRPHRCNEAFALHVLEVIDKSLESATLGRALTLTTTCKQPEPLSARLS
ncbi:MAG TPA: Gfo/Idh/MocA family oxidoreductase [Povalibacter sp.]|nr:Gfo/Idh/MocA family oxidoreductase [Povalibacter sp.]